jgi:DNA-binding LytR/AlgR family response regulator
MICVAIVDDEPLARGVLQTYLQEFGNVQLAGVCKNALEAFALMNKTKVDLLLLDINMPEISGVDFLKTIKDPPLVIFTTAYSEFAVESYELNAVDYLLKPVSKERFAVAMNKALDILQPGLSRAGEEQLPSDGKLLFVRSEGKWIRIDLAKLWFIEGLKDYVRLWTGEGRITVHSTMKNFGEQLLPYPNFLRVHKSYIVNLEFVSEASSTGLKIMDEPIPVGSSYKEEVHRKIGKFRLL